MAAGSESARLSLNQITVAEASLDELLSGCQRAGIDQVGLWRHKLSGLGPQRARALCDDAGVKVTSLCRGGFFTGYLPESGDYPHRQGVADTRAAIDEAAALGADVLVLVCGGTGSGAIDEARRLVAEGIEAVVPHARERGVTLGIEPLHPMYCADRSVIVTIAQALEIAERHAPEEVGLVIDAYHVWWDPRLIEQLERAAERIVGFHVCDWLLETPDMLAGRGMMGDGVIDLRELREQFDRLGYRGPIEVEILNRELWGMDPQRVISLVRERYDAHVA